MKTATREEWLNQMVHFFKADFSKAGFSIDDKKIRVGVGFPSSRGTTSNHRTIGECWSKVHSTDGTYEVIISVSVSDSVTTAAILLHELVHVALDGYMGLNLSQHGHGKSFRALALAVGLAGQMRATIAGEKLRGTLETLVLINGVYPHAELSITGRKKQSTRMIKCVCKKCGYTVRVSRWWLQKATPECPSCKIEMEEGVYTSSLKGESV